MAGSYEHIVDDIDGSFTMASIDNLGDAHEALEDCHGIISRLQAERSVEVPIVYHAEAEQRRLLAEALWWASYRSCAQQIGQHVSKEAIEREASERAQSLHGFIPHSYWGSMPYGARTSDGPPARSLDEYTQQLKNEQESDTE